MSKFSKYSQSRLVIGLVSLFSVLFVAQARYETNPQDCEMISDTTKRTKPKH